jgi:hypothetical protein
MNEFNQNILHLACKKGYFVVIDYLLELNCNRDLIDNYGNAPIHYVIEEFVKDCKGNEMYNYKNLKTKYLHGNNIDTSYLSKLMMSAIIEEIDGIKVRVFTKEYLLMIRPSCCKSSCTNCPWEYNKKVKK